MWTVRKRVFLYNETLPMLFTMIEVQDKVEKKKKDK